MKWLLCLLLCLSPLYGELVWEDDFAQSLVQAEKENKPVLLFFTGSDWSGPAMQMKREILDSAAFKEELAAHFLCVELDFPQHHALKKELIEQNARLKEQFHVNTLPCLLVLDIEGKEMGRWDYLPANGEVLMQELLRTVTLNRKLKAAEALLENQVALSSARLSELYQIALELGQQDRAALLLAEGLRSDHPRFFQLQAYQNLVREGRIGSEEGRALRRELTKERDEETSYSVAIVEFQELSKEKLGLAMVVAPLEEYLARYEKSGSKNVWRTEMMMAQVYMSFDHFQEAYDYAKRALEKAPEEMKGEIAASLKYIESKAKLN